MPGNIPPETGNIEFVDSGQINMPEIIDTEGAPLPNEKQDDIEYIYYNKEGFYLGGLESSLKVFISTQSDYDSAKGSKKWSSVNVDKNLLKEKKVILSHSKFVEKASTIFGESSAYRGNVGIENELTLEMFAIACVHKVNKVAYGINSTQAKLFRNTAIKNRNGTKKQLAVSATIFSLTSEGDPSNGATMWDGAEQAAFSSDDDRFSTGSVEIHMNVIIPKNRND